MTRDIVHDVMKDMMAYYEGDAPRIQHFLKVHSFARLIGREESLDDGLQFILELSALVHDIGIRKAETLYGSSSGRYQEELGPDLAEKLLVKYTITRDAIERIRYLVGHHHSYKDIDGPDYRILIEADFLVNMYEDEMSDSAIEAAYRNIFRTDAGKRICRTMYTRAFADRSAGL